MAAPQQRPQVLVYVLNGPKHAAKKEHALRTARAAYPAHDVVVRNPSSFVAAEGTPKGVALAFLELGQFPDLEEALKAAQIKIQPLPVPPSEAKEAKEAPAKK